MHLPLCFSLGVTGLLDPLLRCGKLLRLRGSALGQFGELLPRLGLLLSSAHEPVPNLGELAGPCRDVLLVRVDLDGKRLLPLLGVTQLLLQRGKLLPPALGLGLNLFELLARGLDLLLDSGELPARFVTVLLNALKLGLRYRDAARQVRGRARAR